MSENLRSRLEAALAPHIYNGHLVDAELGDVLDAVIGTVEQAAERARQLKRGRCRWCKAVRAVAISECVGLAGELEPHRMRCRLHVGSVTHAPLRGRYDDFWGEHVYECTCGVRYRLTGGEFMCPNAAETWRGPIPSRKDVR